MMRACYGVVRGWERVEDPGPKAPSICHDLIQRETITRTISGDVGVGELRGNALACAGKSKATTG